MEDDDPVVQEIPVFLSQALTDNLYIYQYPGKPANREWSGAKIVKAEIKPKNQIVKLEVSLDTYSDKYCVSKGEQIALNTDGPQEYSRKIKEKSEEKAPYFHDGIMDKIVFESSRPCNKTQHYAVAILQDKELHCTPVKGIVQLRPTCTYLDRQSKKKKEDKSDDEEEPSVQQVTVKFARQETELAKKAREKSYEFVSKKTDEESWYQASFRHHDTDHGELERLKLLCSSQESGARLMSSGAEYARALAALSLADKPSITDLCRTLLDSAKLLKFSEIQQVIRSQGISCTESALLTALGSVGALIRGMWTPKEAGGGLGGVPADVLDAVWGHVMYLLSRQNEISWSSLAASCSIPAADLRELLRPLTAPRGHDHHTLRATDPAFCLAHPDLVDRHARCWQAREIVFLEMFQPDPVPKRTRKKSQRDSIGSEPVLSPGPRNPDDDKRKHKRLRHCSAGSQDSL